MPTVYLSTYCLLTYCSVAELEKMKNLLQTFNILTLLEFLAALVNVKFKGF